MKSWLKSPGIGCVTIPKKKSIANHIHQKKITLFKMGQPMSPFMGPFCWTLSATTKKQRKSTDGIKVEFLDSSLRRKGRSRSKSRPRWKWAKPRCHENNEFCLFDEGFPCAFFQFRKKKMGSNTLSAWAFEDGDFAGISDRITKGNLERGTTLGDLSNLINHGH